MVALSKGSQLTIVSNTITPTHDVHHVTGDYGDHISTINVPSPDFCGFLVLIGDDNGNVLWGDGNINISGSVSLGHHATVLVYDPDTDKWYAPID